MIDRMTKSFLDDFLNSQELPSEDEATDFEKFSIYTTLSKEYGNDLEFDINDVTTGNGYKGIDGIAIIINERILATTVQDIVDIIETNKKFSVDYVFFQSKTETKFSGAQINNFGTTVQDFFSDAPQFTPTDEVKRALEIREFIESNFSKTITAPTINLFYITLGKWTSDPSLNTDIHYCVKSLCDVSTFEDVKFHPIDAATLYKYARNLSETTNAIFSFESQVSLPPIDNVDNAYYGLINFNEFKNILIDEDGKIKNVFYDNVRDFLGDNSVNSKIKETLEQRIFDKFPILNNGITIVAESKADSKAKFSISNYQIVNGCQTSHVLYNNRNIDGIGDLRIPLRLIITTDEDLKTQITLATNLQTAITKEQLAAFFEYQKSLEQYYKAVSSSDGRLYYERRTGQYNSDSIKKARIITIKFQIKAVAAMFLNKPHLASGYYGKVFKNVKDILFQSDDKHIIYYVSALALYRMEAFVRSKDIDRKYNKFRYHILMLFRMLTGGIEMPRYFNSRDIEKYCENILCVLNDSSKCLEKFLEVTEIFDTFIDKSNLEIDNQKPFYQENTTTALLEAAKSLIQGN